MATNYTFNARQGDTFNRSFAWKNNDGGPLLDLTGYIIEFGVANTPGGGTNFKYSNPEFITIDALDSSWVVRIPFSETRQWPDGALFYEITLESPDGERITPLEGRLRVAREVVV